VAGDSPHERCFSGFTFNVPDDKFISCCHKNINLLVGKNKTNILIKKIFDFKYFYPTINL